MKKTKKDKQVELAGYRLKQAEESIDEAIYLHSGKKSPRAVINRAYYGMFYAVLALLIFEPYSSSKHSVIPACPESVFRRHKKGFPPPESVRDFYTQIQFNRLS